MRLPLPTLLSQALVAFTIELDNESEHQMPKGLWITSYAMWANFLQFVPDDGVRLRDVDGLARITNLNGMERWGYVYVRPDPADTRAKPPRADWIVRPTPNGHRAKAVWQPLAGIVEQRWHARFGDDDLDNMRSAMRALLRPPDLELPRYLPVVGADMFAKLPKLGKLASAAEPADASSLDLSVLLSRVLLAFTLEFEHESKISLAMSANVLRALGKDGVRVRDLPRITGVSKEAISMVVGFFERRELAVIDRDPTDPRTKLVRLTEKGLRAQSKYRRILADVEERWRARSEDDVAQLRASLERIVGEPTAELSPLFGGLEPHADGWRAKIRKPETLPHYPMVLHRGGYPDGS